MHAPEEITRSLAMSLSAVGHPKLCQFTNAMLVLCAEHYAIYRTAGWDRARITRELHAALLRPGRDLVKGAQGVGEGIDPGREGEMVPKFWDGLLIVRAGGEAGTSRRSSPAGPAAASATSRNPSPGRSANERDDPAARPYG